VALTKGEQRVLGVVKADWESARALLSMWSVSVVNSCSEGLFGSLCKKAAALRMISMMRQRERGGRIETPHGACTPIALSNPQLSRFTNTYRYTPSHKVLYNQANAKHSLSDQTEALFTPQRACIGIKHRIVTPCITPVRLLSRLKPHCAERARDALLCCFLLRLHTTLCVPLQTLVPSYSSGSSSSTQDELPLCSARSPARCEHRRDQARVPCAGRGAPPRQARDRAAAAAGGSSGSVQGGGRFLMPAIVCGVGLWAGVSYCGLFEVQACFVVVEYRGHSHRTALLLPAPQQHIQEAYQLLGDGGYL